METNILNVLIFLGIFVVIIAVMFVIPICGIVTNRAIGKSKKQKTSECKLKK